jgi:hypothetical protein
MIQLNFAGVNSTAIMPPNVFRRIRSHPEASSLISDLRLEIARSAKSNIIGTTEANDHSNKSLPDWSHLEQMPLLDSAIHETLRTSPLLDTSAEHTMLKAVSNPSGFACMQVPRLVFLPCQLTKARKTTPTRHVSTLFILRSKESQSRSIRRYTSRSGMVYM